MSEQTASGLRAVLLRHGFVPCDNPICNCGSWHPRYGLPERMREMEDALAEAGHPLCNANGNLIGNALAALVGERDAFKADAERYRWLLRKGIVGRFSPDPFSNCQCVFEEWNSDKLDRARGEKE